MDFDIVIIGMGLGAAAIAHRAAATGARIVMTPGVGCARFKHLDGGLVAASTLVEAFGTADGAPVHQVGEHTVFRRDALESWATDQVRDRVTVVPDFDDLRVVPHESGGYAVHEERSERILVGRQVVLTEGASPKIGMKAGIRPDFEPEDLLHFGRVILPGVQVGQPMSGEWRTSWGMPAWYSVVPHPDGAIVGASARIENIMRVGRDGREVVQDFLRSPLGRQLGLTEAADAVGMELVPLRSGTAMLPVFADGMLIAPDANGSIDPRSLSRYEDVLRAGMRIGNLMASEWPHSPDWQGHADIWNVRPIPRTPYHDSRETGFIEDGARKRQGLLGKLIKR